MWAIARDGAVFYRGSVSAQSPAGEMQSKTRECLLCFMSIRIEWFVFKQNISTLTIPHLTDAFSNTTYNTTEYSSSPPMLC